MFIIYIYLTNLTITTISTWIYSPSETSTWRLHDELPQSKDNKSRKKGRIDSSAIAGGSLGESSGSHLSRQPLWMHGGMVGASPWQNCPKPYNRCLPRHRCHWRYNLGVSLAWFGRCQRWRFRLEFTGFFFSHLAVFIPRHANKQFCTETHVLLFFVFFSLFF